MDGGARNHDVEISAQGRTRREALDNLDAVVAALNGDDGREPTEEEMRAADIDLEENDQRGILRDRGIDRCLVG